jgi:hypothetical protein
MTTQYHAPSGTFQGLAADTKPDAKRYPGARFIEYDTGLQFFSDGAAWQALSVLGNPIPFHFLLPSQVHVASADTVHWDLFNAHASLVVRIMSILQIPNITTAVTGIVFDWLLERTTAVGTGGSALTAWLSDLSQAALDAAITARSKPTGGATAGVDLRNYSLSSEETNAATIQIASQGGLELLPPMLQPRLGGRGLILRTNQGIRCVQVTNSNAGNTGWLIGFAVERATG